MSLLSLDDRITLIQSHALSLKRAQTSNNMDDLRSYFEAIASIAAEGAQIYTVEDDNGGRTPEAVSGT